MHACKCVVTMQTNLQVEFGIETIQKTPPSSWSTVTEEKHRSLITSLNVTEGGTSIIFLVHLEPSGQNPDLEAGSFGHNLMNLSRYSDVSND